MTDVSILIATHRRPGLLERTLRSIGAAREADRAQLVVADNADDPETAAVCRRVADETGMRLGRVVETKPGKNAALNRALGQVEGALVLFTDDDVIVDEAWIESMRDAAGRWPTHDAFGGRVLPTWPDGCPEHLKRSRFAGVCFSALDPELPEGPSGDFLPFGPNMAVRRRVFERGIRFNEEVGPRGRSYIMGSETELVRRLRAEGEPPVFVPASVVQHTVRPEQLGLRSLLRRGVRYGRMQAYLEHRNGRGAGEARVPPHLLRAAAEHGGASLWALARRDRAAAFEAAMQAATVVGKIRQRLGR